MSPQRVDHRLELAGGICGFAALQGWSPVHCAADGVNINVLNAFLRSTTQDILNAADHKVLPVLFWLLHTMYVTACLLSSQQWWM